jgi:Protein of unknown function (DUF1761)
MELAEIIDLTQVNYWAVAAAALAHMLVGLVWFSKPLFGKTWMDITGRDLTPARGLIPLAIVGHLTIALVLALILDFTGITTVLDGIAIGLLVWLGFVVTLEIGELVWERIPFRLFLLRVGNHAVALSAAAAILTVWR